MSLVWIILSTCRALYLSMNDEWDWRALCRKCERVYAKYGGGDLEIPSLPSDDPVGVLDETDVQDRVLRFVVYILWLKRQPHAFEKYLVVREHHYDLSKESVYKLWML